MISKDRHDFIVQKRWKTAQLIICYVGKFPWDTSLDMLEKDEDVQKKKDQFVLITRNDEYYEEIHARGYRTIVNSQRDIDITTSDKKMNKIKTNDIESIKKRELQKKVDLLCSIEIFENISIKNFRDLLQSAKEEVYQTGEFVVKEGTIGTKFYFVMSGLVCIFNNART